MTGLTYRASGVDPTRADMALALVRERIARTKTPEVIGDIGAFGGLFASPGADRVLVATTDGVGTKLEIARLLDRHEVVGTDLVHHCVNDALAMGAEPLFFLDYFSTSRIDAAVFARVVGAMADACAAHGCALLGGETAEMPGMYAPGAYDLAGFLVGMVAREAILRADSVREGDACIGLPSNGLHTNGYTLARAIAHQQLHGKAAKAILARFVSLYPDATFPTPDRVLVAGYFGCGTRRRYGFTVFQPSGYFSLASSSETAGMMITSSPLFQFTGVDTLCFAVSWSESMTRRISSKLRPVLCG